MQFSETSLAVLITSLIFIDLVDPIFLKSYLSTVSNVLFCNKLFLSDDLEGQLIFLRGLLVGQPFVINEMIPEIRNHYNSEKPKPLVLYFHGPVGVGKTFVAEHFLNMNFFRNRHLFDPAEFLQYDDDYDFSAFENYRNHLKSTIDLAIKSCHRSLFVFDGVDELPKGFFEDLPPFFRNPKLDYSGSMFIFISQAGSEDIISAASYMRKSGLDRYDFDYGSFISHMKNMSIMEKIWDMAVGLVNLVKKSEEIKEVKEYFIPFLPLEPSHVRMCIREEMEVLRYNEGRLNLTKVLPLVGCSPDSEFCPFGCKLVSTKLIIAFTQHDEL